MDNVFVKAKGLRKNHILRLSQIIPFLKGLICQCVHWFRMHRIIILMKIPGLVSVNLVNGNTAHPFER